MHGCRSRPSASASTSTTSPPCATRAAGGIPIRSRPPRSRLRPAPTASPRICARIAVTSSTTISPGSRSASQSRSISKWRRRPRWSASPARCGRTPPASCPSGARSAPPKAGSTPPASAKRLRGTVGKLTEAGIRVSLFIAAEPAQIEAAAAIGAPVIEIHTGAWCEAVAAGDAAASAAEFERIVRGANARQARGPRSPCRPRPRFRHRGGDRGLAARSPSSISGIF